VLKNILIELHVGSASPARLSQELARAGLPIRSAGVRHLYVEVAAETPETAMALLREAVPSRGMELSPAFIPSI
jgi:hypothetical protein